MKLRAEGIQRILHRLYPKPTIPLQHSDPYTLLIAVLLSAQCTDVRVNTITPKLFAKARTPDEMIGLTIAEIESVVRPCGLGPSKAKNIWHLSKLIIENHKGEVPHTFETLEELPGVGHKTASVVMSQAFQKPAFPVDTHIKRCAVRWGLSKAKSVEKIEADLKRLFPKNSWNLLHLQIIYCAREYCPARGHNVSNCPVCSWLQNF